MISFSASMTIFARGFCLFVVLVTFILPGCKREDTTTRWVPKEQAPVATDFGARMTGGHREIDWSVPPKWVEQPPSGMRIGSFLFKGPENQTADISVIQLSGEAGGDVPNINRWRGQIELPPLTDAQSKNPGKLIKAAGRDMLLVDFKNKGQGVVAAICREGESTWFFKMTGGSAAVGAAKPDFVKFLESLHFHQHAHE